MYFLSFLVFLFFLLQFIKKLIFGFKMLFNNSFTITTFFYLSMRLNKKLPKLWLANFTVEFGPKRTPSSLNCLRFNTKLDGSQFAKFDWISLLILGLKRLQILAFSSTFAEFF